MTEDGRAEADDATEGTEVTLLSATVEDTGAGSGGRAAGRDTTGAEVITEENALEEIAEGAGITLLDAATGDNDGVKLSTDDSSSGAEDTLAAPVEDRTAELSGRALKAELPEATLELAAATTDDTEEATTEEGGKTEELAAPGRETLDVNTPAEEPVTLNEDMARTGPIASVLKAVDDLCTASHGDWCLRAAASRAAIRPGKGAESTAVLVN